jgi:DNA-binding MarR family transcriptional regulator/GNAT superfamily N-acetyltransferase
MTLLDIGPDALVEDIRSFNRFYTAHVGALEEHLLESPFTLAEARVLYELGLRDGVTAAVLARELSIDPAYVSRIVRRFVQSGHVTRLPDPADGRGRILVLTEPGRYAFERLVQASRARVGRIVAVLSSERRAALAAAMRRVREILGDAAEAEKPVTIRSHRNGEVSWIVHRQATLYRDEYGWNERFEGLVAEVAANFLKSHDPAREHCWVAERGGAILGSVFLVDFGHGVAKLRLLYVEPAARGQGIGRRLVEECLGFARRAGYRRMTLWTNDCLTDARRLYDSLGFEQVAEGPHSDFGPPMVGQVLERDL